MQSEASIKTRFSSTNRPKHNGRPRGSSPTDWLRKLSKTKINFQNPITGLPDKAEVSYVVALQLILKATQDSDLPSIREYLDRIDGKVAQTLVNEGSIPGNELKIIVIHPQTKKEETPIYNGNTLRVNI
jgi:hypothetical protein